MTDELAEINGTKPKVLLKDGEQAEAKSMTSSSVYTIKRTWDHYYCSCVEKPSEMKLETMVKYRSSSYDLCLCLKGGAPVNARSCKHLRSMLGEEYENARPLWKNPDGSPPKTTKKKAPKGKVAAQASSNSSAKRKAQDDADDEYLDGKRPPNKRSRTGQSSRATKAAEQIDDDGEDDGDSGIAKAPELLLANKWDLENGTDPKGWWASEKLDGVRVFYDGKGMLSRLGNPFTTPRWFLDKLPQDITLDGELFAGRNNFQDTVSIVKTVNSPHWKNITFQIFDIPSMADETFESRLEYLKRTFMENNKPKIEQIDVVQQTLVRDREHVLEMLKDIEKVGGEGLMLRKPQSKYEGTRSSTLLKVKTFYDGEARVEGYTAGKGKHAGKTGALKCVMASGKKFNVGSGLSDKQRVKPPTIGSIIVYRFQELTRDNVPRFPTFVGVSADKTEPKDAEVPDHRKLPTV